jgi:hypothetical protein
MMRRHARPVRVGSALLCCSAVCVGASFSQIKRIAHDDELLRNAGVSLTDVQFRLPCNAAIIETSDPPEFDNYLYVQSKTELNLFSLEDGYLMPELQLKLRAIESISLIEHGAGYQMQMFSHNRVIALSFQRGEISAVFLWLTQQGVPVRKALPPITTSVSTNPFHL